MDAVINQILGGFVGFIFAYALARKQRTWDVNRARKEERGKHIQIVRVPLEIIRDEINTSYHIHSYFNRETEDKILRQIREAIYSLGDGELMQAYEVSKRPMHEFATATTNPKEIGEKCLPHIKAMLERLGEISEKD